MERNEHNVAPVFDKDTKGEALPLSEWKKWSYLQYYEECRELARALIAAGVEQVTHLLVTVLVHEEDASYNSHVHVASKATVCSDRVYGFCSSTLSPSSVSTRPNG